MRVFLLICVLIHSSVTQAPYISLFFDAIKFDYVNDDPGANAEFTGFAAPYNYVFSEVSTEDYCQSTASGTIVSETKTCIDSTFDQSKCIHALSLGNFQNLQENDCTPPADTSGGNYWCQWTSLRHTRVYLGEGNWPPQLKMFFHIYETDLVVNPYGGPLSTEEDPGSRMDFDFDDFDSWPFDFDSIANLPAGGAHKSHSFSVTSSDGNAATFHVRFYPEYLATAPPTETVLWRDNQYIHGGCCNEAYGSGDTTWDLSWTSATTLSLQGGECTGSGSCDNVAPTCNSNTECIDAFREYGAAQGNVYTFDFGFAGYNKFELRGSDSSCLATPVSSTEWDIVKFGGGETHRLWKDGSVTCNVCAATIDDFEWTSAASLRVQGTCVGAGSCDDVQTSCDGDDKGDKYIDIYRAGGTGQANMYTFTWKHGGVDNEMFTTFAARGSDSSCLATPVTGGYNIVTFKAGQTHRLFADGTVQCGSVTCLATIDDFSWTSAATLVLGSCAGSGSCDNIQTGCIGDAKSINIYRAGATGQANMYTFTWQHGLGGGDALFTTFGVRGSDTSCLATVITAGSEWNIVTFQGGQTNRFYEDGTVECNAVSCLATVDDFSWTSAATLTLGSCTGIGSCDDVQTTCDGQHKYIDISREEGQAQANVYTFTWGHGYGGGDELFVAFGLRGTDSSCLATVLPAGAGWGIITFQGGETHRFYEDGTVECSPGSARRLARGNITTIAQ